MVLVKTISFTSSSVLPEDDLLLLQPSHQTLRKAESFREERIYLDTPDWRLGKAGDWLFLQQRGSYPLFLCEGTGPQLTSSSYVAKQPHFLWELPEETRSRLSSKIRMRSLANRLLAQLRIQVFRLEDKRQKTVARLHLMTGRVLRPRSRQGGSIQSRLVAIPLKGYDKAFFKLVSKLRSSPIFNEVDESLYDEGLRTLGLDLGRGTLEPPRIESGMSTFQGMGRLLDHLRQVIESNACQLPEPEDTEFLHHYRVAIRKTRTLLGEAKTLYPQRSLERFSDFFSWLGSVTGSARDLDVYLLKLSGYQSDWPERFGAQLAELYSQLEFARAEEQEKLVRILNGDRYHRGMAHWLQFLQGSSSSRMRDAQKHIEKFARERIWRRYRKIRKTGKKLDPEGPASRVHRLRIQFKKLRYLIEFFSPLFTEQPIHRILGEIKTMQDDLGDFNDCVVQAAWLNEQAHRYLRKSRSSLHDSLALLSEDLQQQAGRLRRQSCDHFQRFVTPQNRNLFRQLFKEQ